MQGKAGHGCGNFAHLRTIPALDLSHRANLAFAELSGWHCTQVGKIPAPRPACYVYILRSSSELMPYHCTVTSCLLMTCRLYLSSLFGLGVVCRGTVDFGIPSSRALSAVTVPLTVVQISQRVTSPLA